MNNPSERDQRYLDLIVKRIKVSSLYKPKFGQGIAVSLEGFQQLYGSDPFYSWFGLNNPMVYAAHKAAGGITSLYRQIGTGCESLFRQIICDQFDLTTEQATWSYTVKGSGFKDRKLSLDARIDANYLQSTVHQRSFHDWMLSATRQVGIDAGIANALKGCVFEVRQGYKSKDSKRQNADIVNAGTAYTQGYLSVVAMLSTQIDNDVAVRYVHAGWLLLRGSLENSATASTYAFCSEVLGFDLAAFFQKYSEHLKTTVDQVLQSLLKPGAEPVVNETDREEELGLDEEGNDFEV